MIQLFDALAHPTIQGTWTKQRNLCTSFSYLVEELTSNHYVGACAIGMPNIGNYNHEVFIQYCHQYPMLTPVAAITLNDMETAHISLPNLAKLGYKGIKIHPRWAAISPQKHASLLTHTFQLAVQYNLIVFYCTYLHCRFPHYPTRDPFFSLVNILQQSQQTKVVLVHGGDVQIMRYAELVRFNPNLLLDLSMTIMKYPKSSIDMDIKFLFAHFDRRICIGSDFPEYTHAQVRERFNFFGQGIARTKLENIAYKNICTFLDLHI